MPEIKADHHMCTNWIYGGRTNIETWMLLGSNVHFTIYTLKWKNCVFSLVTHEMFILNRYSFFSNYPSSNAWVKNSNTTEEEGFQSSHKLIRWILRNILRLNGCSSTLHDYLRGVMGIISNTMLSHSQVCPRAEHWAEHSEITQSKSKVQTGFKIIFQSLCS